MNRKIIGQLLKNLSCERVKLLEYSPKLKRLRYVSVAITTGDSERLLVLFDMTILQSSIIHFLFF